MKIKLIDFGLKADHHPFRPHENDAGADVFMPYDCELKPGEVARIPLGFGLVSPDGFAGYVFPRSSMAAKGLVCELPPIDSGYRGEIIFSLPFWKILERGKYSGKAVNPSKCICNLQLYYGSAALTVTKIHLKKI